MKAGYDALTDSNDEHVSFTSKYPSLNVAYFDTVNLNYVSGNTSDSVDVPHTLGYVPMVVAYYLPSSSKSYPLPTNSFVATELVDQIQNISWSITTTTLSFVVNALDLTPFGGGDTFTGSGTLAIKYYIFYNQLD